MTSTKNIFYSFLEKSIKECFICAFYPYKSGPDLEFSQGGGGHFQNFSKN